MGQKLVEKALKCLVRKRSPLIIFLVETKANKDRVDEVYRNIDYVNILTIQAR